MAGQGRSIAAMGAAFLVVMPLAAWLGRPFMVEEAPDVPQEPTGTSGLALLAGSLLFVALAVGMAMFILWAVRTGRHYLLRYLVLGAVAIALLVVVVQPASWLARWTGEGPALAAGVAAAVAGAVLLHRRPTWPVLNTVGLLVAAGVAGLAGAVLGPTPVLFLLVAVAAYDQVAVKRTKHMQKLARAALDLRLPVALRFGGATASPKAASSVPAPARPPAARVPTPAPPPAAPSPAPTLPPAAAPTPSAGPARRARPSAVLMGLGDFVFPSALVVAASDPRHDWGWLPAVVTGLGVLAGYAVLVRVALRGDAQPGLPLLNGGAAAGFLLGVLAATGTLVFW